MFNGLPSCFSPSMFVVLFVACCIFPSLFLILENLFEESKVNHQINKRINKNNEWISKIILTEALEEVMVYRSFFLSIYIYIYTWMIIYVYVFILCLWPVYYRCINLKYRDCLCLWFAEISFFVVVLLWSNSTSNICSTRMWY